MSWFDKVKQQIKGEVKDLVAKGKAIQSAAVDLHGVVKGEKQLSDVVAEQRPKLQGYIRRELGPRWYRLIYDDNAARPALYTAYARTPLAWVVKPDRFVGFCLDHRDTLLGERELRVEAMRERVELAASDERERAALAAHLAALHGVEAADPRVGEEVALAIKLARSVPALLGSTAAAARAAGRFDALFPVLQEVEYHMLSRPGADPAAEEAGEPPSAEAPPAEPPARAASLREVLESSYLALALIQTLSDRSVAQSLPPLIDVDLRPARAALARVLGGATAALDAELSKIVDEADFMARVGKVVGVAIPVIAVAATLASFADAAVGAADGGAVAAEVGGGEVVSSSGISASDHAISNAYTGALFGSECVARF